jgi:hypothetical protein
MKTQISRLAHDPEKRYSAVYQQQGRMITDSDWNELVSVLHERIERTLGEVVGNGVPRASRLTVTKVGSSFQIQPGTVYVDGLRSELRPAVAPAPGSAAAPVAFTAQPDFPGAPNPPADARIYVDVWERSVVSLEDPALRDPGLHGADTCSRTQTMLQLKCCPATLSPTDPAKNPRVGEGVVSLSLWANSEAGERVDPCLTQTSERSRIGNYLFRIEVHDAKLTASGANESLELTLKWSSENGAEQHSLVWRDETGTEIRNYENLPPDFLSGHYTYELYDDACEKHLGAHLLASFTPSRGLFRTAAQLTGTPPQIEGRDACYVRRWDGYLTLTLSRATSARNWVPNPTTLAGVDKGEALRTQDPGYGYVEFLASGSVGSLRASLESLSVTLELGDHAFLPGDYWLAVVREGGEYYEDASVDRRVEVLRGGKPVGIVHHYLELAQVAGGAIRPYTADGVEARRLDFPPLTNLSAERVGYDPTSQGGRWDDINESVGGLPRRPITVQEALDDLAQNLESSDVSYVLPPCLTTDYGSPTMNALIAADIANKVTGADGKTRTKLEDLANALLCKLDARRLPYDPTVAPERWSDVTEQTWVRKFGGAGNDVNFGLAVDQLGNIVIAGRFQGTVAFGAIALTSAGGFDGYLAKLDPAGNVLWARQFGSFGTDRGEALAVDANGNIVLVGTFSGTLTLGTVPPLTAVSTSDGFVAKFDPAGNCLWARRMGGASGTAGGALAIAPNGTIAACGYYVGAFTISGSALTVAGAGVADVFFVTLDPNGLPTQLKGFGAPGTDGASSVVADPAGGFVLSGVFQNTVTFGTATLSALTESDLFVVKLDVASNVVWARSFGGRMADNPAVTMGPGGTVVVTGSFIGTMTFDAPLTSAAGSADAFLALLEPTGAPRWSRRFGGTSTDVARTVAVRGDRIVIGGYFGGVIDFGGGSLMAESIDAFLAVFDANGVYQHAERFGGPGQTLGVSVAVTSDNALLLAGMISGNVEFGGTLLTSDGASDAFVTKLRFEGPRTVQDAIDELVRQLDSADIAYLMPACASEHDSVRKRLPSLSGLPNGAETRVASVLNGLLCELDAGAIPYSSRDTTVPAGSIRDLMVKKVGGDSMAGPLTINDPGTSVVTLKVNGVLETQELRLLAPAGTPDRAVLTYEASSGLARWRQTSLTAWNLTGGALTTDPVSVTGNVGIGTASPRAKLEVNGAIMPAAGNAASAGILFPPNPGNGAGDAAWIRYYARTGEATTFEIGTSNDPNDHIALMASGNVGVGTTEPAAKLHVVGGAIMPTVGNAATAGIMFPQNAFTGGGDAAWIRYYARTGESTTFEIGTSNDPDDHIALMASGNVGVGTTAPVNKLDVAGDVALNGKHAFRASADGWLRLNQDGANTAGTHTPGLFAPNSLNVGGRNGWVNPGGGNAWVAGQLVSSSVVTSGEIEAQGAFLRVRGAGNEQTYLGGDGAGSDVQIGSFNGAIGGVGFWNAQNAQYMDIHYLRSFPHSDARSKTNIEGISGALDVVKRLRGVLYDWKAENLRSKHGKEAGFIAQEIQEVLPAAVNEDGRGLLGIAMNAIPPYLVEAIKEQQTEIDMLRKAVAALGEKVAELASRAGEKEGKR